MADYNTVADYIPEFRMADPWVTANISVTDLLAHRSGLVRRKVPKRALERVGFR